MTLNMSEPEMDGRSRRIDTYAKNVAGKSISILLKYY